MLSYDQLIEHGYYWRKSSAGEKDIVFFDENGIHTNGWDIAETLTEQVGAWFIGPLVEPSFDEGVITSQGDILQVIDNDNFDQLVCRRAEIFFSPNEDRTPSLNARIVYHTEWWAYSNGMRRGVRHGPEIRADLAELVGRQFDAGIGIPIPTTAVARAIVLSFEDLARRFV